MAPVPYDERGWRATCYTTGMEHSPNERDGHRMGAHYADKILKGAKPGELPIYLACSSTPRKFFRALTSRLCSGDVDVRQFVAG
jgi:hypothetical protein